MSYPPYQGHGQPPYDQYAQYPPNQGHSPYPQTHYQPPPMAHAPPAQPPLPPGWLSQWDQASNRPFYVEQATGRTQWEPPAAHFAPPSAPPPHAGYAPPPGQHPPFGGPQAQPSYPPLGSGPPTPASPGYIVGQVPPTDLNGPAIELREAMKGFGTNEKKLIQTFSLVPDPQHMEKIRRTYDDRFRRDLIKDLSSETSSWFKEGLTAVARGPLQQDAYLIDRAIRGLGTKESILDEVCLGRSNADLTAIKQCYHQMFRKDMVQEIKDDLSLKTERLYEYVLSCRRAEESAPCLPHEIDQKVDRLQQATEGTKLGANQDPVCQILAFSSDGQLRAINARYLEKYRKPLDEVLSKEFSGHMKHALRLMLARAVDKVKSDAEGLEESMKGLGTKDELLVNRIVKAHWNREHMRQVNVAYRRFFNKSLADRVRGETSGDYQRLMVALVGQ